MKVRDAMMPCRDGFDGSVEIVPEGVQTLDISGTELRRRLKTGAVLDFL